MRLRRECQCQFCKCEKCGGAVFAKKEKRPPPIIGPPIVYNDGISPLVAGVFGALLFAALIIFALERASP